MLRGFASAAAIITATSVVKDILGVKVAKSAFIHEALPAVLEKVPEADGVTLAYGIVSLVFMVVWKILPKHFSRFKALKKVPGSLAAVVLFIIISAIMCSITGVKGKLDTSITAVPAAGASLPAIPYLEAMETWSCSHPNTQLTYNVTGSSAGRSMLLEDKLVFAASDELPRLSPQLAANGIVAVPAIVGAVVPAFRLPNVGVNDADQLVLDCNTTGRIFSGAVPMWDDDAIKVLNPRLALPHARIQVGVRADGSGTTEAFTRALSACSPDFQAAVGVSSRPVWPAALAVSYHRGNGKVARFLADTDFGISYTSMAHADALQVTTVRFKNTAGLVVAANATTLRAATEEFGDAVGVADDFFARSFASTNGSWPIVTQSYFLMHGSRVPAGFTCDHKARALAFAMWFLSSQDVVEAVEGLGFVSPSPEARAAALQTLVTDVTCAGARIVSSPPAVEVVRTLGYWGCQPEYYTAPTEVLKCAGMKIVGHVPPALPTPVMPDVPWSVFLQLVTDALLITIVAFLEHVAVSKMYAVRFSYDVDASQELIALGFACFAGGLFQGFPAMGGFSRSAVNADSGATSQVSLLVSAIALSVLLFVIGPAVYFLPKPVLGAIVLVAVLGLVDVAGAKRLWRVNRFDLVIMATAFFCTLFLGVETGILLAMGVSITVFVGISTNPTVQELGRLRGTVVYREVSREDGVEEIPRVRVLAFMGPLWFANTAVLKEYMSSSRERYAAGGAVYSYRPWDGYVLDCSNISFIDSTALSALGEMADYLDSIKIKVVLACANETVVAALANDDVNMDVFYSVHDAVKALVAYSAKKRFQVAGGTAISAVRLQRLVSRMGGDAGSTTGKADDSDDAKAEGGGTAGLSRLEAASALLRRGSAKSMSMLRGGSSAAKAPRVGGAASGDARVVSIGDVRVRGSPSAGEAEDDESAGASSGTGAAAPTGGAGSGGAGHRGAADA